MHRCEVDGHANEGCVKCTVVRFDGHAKESCVVLVIECERVLSAIE